MITITLPEIHGGVSEAQLVRWMVVEGEEIEQDQPICEVQTDKAVMELPAPKRGKVERLIARKGETLMTGDPLLSLQEMQEEDQPRRVLATPSVRRMAREWNIDLEQIQGSGKEGRILIADLKQRREQAETQEQARSLSPWRQKIAAQLSQSVQNKPHVTHFDECDVSGLVNWYELYHEKPVTYSALLLKVVAKTLLDHPRFNATFDEERQEVRVHSQIHLGVATQTDQGVIVPVLRQVERKSITDIATELRILVQKARQGQLQPDEITGSTFTVSNAGALGGLWATPIIQPPEVAILATSQIRRKPIVTANGQVGTGWRMNVSLSFDHRVLDGADAIRFTQTLQRYTQQPLHLLD
jgi:pyruvate dehydrogenase E2 component (dihydrolipoamide acetyltransferase)